MSRGETRNAARLGAVQALYELDIAGKGVDEAMAEFEAHWLGREVEDLAFKPADAPFFRDIVAGVVREQRMLDPVIDKALAKGWPLRRIETVLRSILRCGAYELFFRSDVPPKVTISEYVEITRDFYEDDEIGLVNAVLDSLAREAKPDEMGAKTRG